jgi:hypothetical protein
MNEKTILSDLEIEVEVLEEKVVPSGWMDWIYPF